MEVKKRFKKRRPCTIQGIRRYINRIINSLFSINEEANKLEKIINEEGKYPYIDTRGEGKKFKKTK